MTDRITKLRARLFQEKPRICPERARYFTSVMRQTEGEPIAIRRAKAFYEVLDKMSLYVLDHELIVGNHASKPKASPVFPEYSVDWIINEFNGDPYHYHERPGDRFYYEEETKQELLENLQYWKGNTLYDRLRKNLPDECNQAWEVNALDDTWVSACGFGNVIIDYEMVLNKGLQDVIRRAEERISRLDLAEPGAIRKKWFLEAAILSNKAIINYCNRLSKKVSGMASEEADPVRREELEKIAAICANVPANPARSFWEAVQAYWILLMMVQLETNGHAISLGRFDQYLYPFYKKDVESGTLTREQALELIEAFFIKANEVNKLRSWPDTAYFMGYQMFNNLGIGGQTVDGRDAVNEVSWLTLEACGEVKLFTPSVSIKWFEGTSKEFLDYALRVCQEHKGGQPAFYNDLGFMRSLQNMGIAREDAVNWSPVGCIEASIPGKLDFATKGPWFNTAKILDMALHGGKDRTTGQVPCPGTGDLSTFKSMDEVFDAFKRQLDHYMHLAVAMEHVNDEMHKEMDLNPFRSSLVWDCIERGKDLIEGGSIYSADGGPSGGMITAGDSLAAIERVVFQEGLITGAQLLHALDTDFSDDTTTPKGEEIRQMLINKAPKYGNDLDEADKWPARTIEYIGSTLQGRYKNSRYGQGPVPCCFTLSQSSSTGNIAFGSTLGATADGRKAGEPLNNGVSPCNGAEKCGPTAAINSVSKLPSVYLQKGAIFNVRLTPDSLLSPEGREKVIALIRTLFLKYGLHIQFNVVSSQVLREAQKHPEKFQDLIIRISGYSALFTPLDPKVQEDIIQRMEFDLRQ